MEKKNLSEYHSLHQHQIVTQIWLPLAAGILIFLGLAVLAVISTSANGGEEVKFASISLIILLLPALVVALFLIVLFAILIFGVYKLTSILPRYSLLARGYVFLASDYIQLWAARAMQPILAIRAWMAAAAKFLFYLSKPKQLINPGDSHELK
jgi:hypothetical protein